MEIFSGFMVIVGIFGFLLTVVWLILPFVVFAIKAKLDRSHLLLEEIDRRLVELERRLSSGEDASPRDQPEQRSMPAD